MCWVILKIQHFEPLNVVACHQILPIVLVYTYLIICLLLAYSQFYGVQKEHYCMRLCLLLRKMQPYQDSLCHRNVFVKSLDISFFNFLLKV